MRRLLCWMVLLTLGLLARGSWAQDSVVPVSAAMAQTNQPLGTRMGSFLVIPHADVDALYNDNIYASNRFRKGDLITHVRPGVAVQSTWSRHVLNAVAEGDLARYATHTHEDTNDYLLGLDGRLDVRHGTSIGGGVAYAQSHEDREDPNTLSNILATAKEPTRYTTATARLGALRELGRLNARLDGEIRHYDYRNGESTNGALIAYDQRNRTHYVSTARVGYQVSPALEPFVQAQLDERQYDQTTVFDRSSQGVSGVAGAVVDFNQRLHADANTGYTRRSYRDGQRDVTTPVAALGLSWNVTRLTTLKARAQRSVEESFIGSNRADVRSAATLGLEHAFGYRLLGVAELAYANDHYAHNFGGDAPEVNERLAGGRLGLTYYLNRRLSAALAYQYDHRLLKPGNDYDFDRHQIMVSLRATY